MGRGARHQRHANAAIGVTAVMAKVLKFKGSQVRPAAAAPGRSRPPTAREFDDSQDRLKFENEASKLFQRIVERFGVDDRHRGIDEARRIFDKFSAPPSPQRVAEIKNWALLDLCDLFAPNVRKLARELAEENKTLPRAERHGPRGSTDPFVMDRHIRRLRKERKEALEKGTWGGPVPEWWWKKHPRQRV
jgi:hypothetical protein